MEHILTGPYNKPTNNSRRPPRGAYLFAKVKKPTQSKAMLIKCSLSYRIRHCE
ncbi:MAG: hypothetical protein ACMX3H_06660 [Sodalis sp. (in: enterobacteria)]|uniref:hypothetical protein n=1 Tax=Sodalis sp. (in: enterobacteria) TaxID=1898979 RepID=UPI0039E63C64